MIKWAVSVSKDRSFPDWIVSELQMNLEKFIGHLPLKVIKNLISEIFIYLGSKS